VGDKQDAPTREKHALRNGFVSGWILAAGAFSPERMKRAKASFLRTDIFSARKMAEELRRHMPQTLRFAARRPAGTREALPGATSQGLRPVKNINSYDNKNKFV
jgi:hypothetical protein